MEAVKGIEIIGLTVKSNENTFTFNPVLLIDEESVLLIDAGMPFQSEEILQAFEREGIPFSKLKTIIFTHQDLDHIGGAPSILNKGDGSIQVLAHFLDKPYIEGVKTLIKADLSKISEEKKRSLPKQMISLYENLPKVKIDKTVEDREKLDFFGGMEVIHTPGHTPGHISLYLEKTKTLIAGDAMVIHDGVLIGPIEQNTPNMKEAIASLEKILDYDIEQVICYHGGLFRGSPHETIKNLLEQNK
jgi:glyoxylase-like metal-dependent hydrolase (beta-lactamase superfamily II)